MIKHLDSNEQALANRGLEILEYLKKALRGDFYRSYIERHKDRINIDLFATSIASILYPIATVYLSYSLVTEVKRLRKLKHASEEVRKVASKLPGLPKIKYLLVALLTLLASISSIMMLKIDIELKRKQLKKQQKK